MLSAMLRVLFPSWNFFDRKGEQFELQFQNMSDKSALWQMFFISASPRNFLNLFFNAPYNLQLAYKSNVDRFMAEAQGLTRAQIENLESYKFIERMISFERIKAQKLTGEFRFRLLLTNGEEIFMSDRIRSDV